MKKEQGFTLSGKSIVSVAPEILTIVSASALSAMRLAGANAVKRIASTT
jgi:tetrahydromethanopterin S-methyltransferase subunit C